MLISSSTSTISTPRITPPALSHGSSARSFPVQAQAAGVKTSLPMQAVPTQKFGSLNVPLRDNLYDSQRLGAVQFAGPSVLRRNSHSPLTTSRPLITRGSHHGTASVPAPAASTPRPQASGSGYAAASYSPPPNPRMQPPSSAGMQATKSVSSITVGSFRAPVRPSSASSGTQSEPVRAAAVSQSAASRPASGWESRSGGVPHPQRSNSRSNMEVWATAPSPLRQGISPRSVSVVDKMGTAAEVCAEATSTQSQRPAAAPYAEELLLAETESAMTSGTQTPLLPSAAHAGGDGLLAGDSSDIGVSIEVLAKGVSTASTAASQLQVSSARCATPTAASDKSRVEGMQRLVTPPAQRLATPERSTGIIEEEPSADFAFCNEKFRLGNDGAALQKHIERHKRARERRNGQNSPTRYDPSARRPVCPSGTSSPRSGHARSPRQAKGFRWQHATPVLSPRSEGRSTKNARLPGNILARLKQEVQDTA